MKRPLKAELTRKGITYAQLTGQLTDTDVMDSETNIRNKVSGASSHRVFLLQCLNAIGVSSRDLQE